MNPTSR